jgi:spoIIIJ-associated protein
MQPIEVTAKSLDEAKKVAAEKLGVDVSRIEATVLEQTKGLFGKTNVRVSAQVIEDASAATEAPKPAEAPAKEPSKGRRGSRKEPIHDVQEAFEAPAPEPVAAAPAAEEGQTGRRGRGGRGGKKQPETQEPAEPVEAQEAEPEVVATQEDAEKLAGVLRELIASADLNVDVKTAGVNGRYVNLQLDGRDAAFLVGKHGEVLNALQYLVNIIGSRRIANGVRTTLDGNDYRKRREETLTSLATNIAEQVKKRGEEAVLDALPAFERRIVHKALSTMPGITTYSEGEEPNRRVVIAPAE